MNFWDELFASGGGENHQQAEMRLLRKHGRPLLLIPAKPRLAIQCLALYPAQTSQARLAKGILRRLWQFGLFIKTEPVQLKISENVPLVRFLSSIGPDTSGQLPAFGILAGNPVGGTQRFVILLFNAQNQPAAIIKAGSTPAAQELIASEKAFLLTAPSGTRGIPQVRSSFESPCLNAFALDFFEGSSPQAKDEHLLPELLTAWLRREQKTALRDFPEWAALKKHFGRANADNKVIACASDRMIQSAIQHGDFAPWNIKVSPTGSWTALDWERGKINGIPGWDWFHYLIQTSILVRKIPIAALENRVEELLLSPAFKRYAEKAAIIGIERPLLLMYLAQLVEVIKPAEGLTENEALFQSLKRRWIY